MAPALERRVGVWIGLFAQALALWGGAALVALSVMTLVSIVGRLLIPLGLAPVPGDFELVEAGCALAVFAFLPWCQYRRGHVTVDLFILGLPPRMRVALSLISNVLLTGVSALIAWRLQVGMVDMRGYGETTLILQMPVWWGYAGALVGAWGFVIVCAYSVWRSLNEMLAGVEGVA